MTYKLGFYETVQIANVTGDMQNLIIFGSKDQVFCTIGKPDKGKGGHLLQSKSNHRSSYQQRDPGFERGDGG